MQAPTLCSDVLSTSWKGEGSMRQLLKHTFFSSSSCSQTSIWHREKKSSQVQRSNLHQPLSQAVDFSQWASMIYLSWVRFPTCPILLPTSWLTGIQRRAVRTPFLRGNLKPTSFQKPNTMFLFFFPTALSALFHFLYIYIPSQRFLFPSTLCF